jgi:hypothetical protein
MMNNYNFMVRAIVVNNDKAAAVAFVNKLRIYPLSERQNPKALPAVSFSGKAVVTTRRAASNTGRDLRRSSTTAPFTNAPLLHGHAQAVGHRKRQGVRT